MNTVISIILLYIDYVDIINVLPASAYYYFSFKSKSLRIVIKKSDWKPQYKTGQTKKPYNELLKYGIIARNNLLSQTTANNIA